MRKIQYTSNKERYIMSAEDTKTKTLPSVWNEPFPQSVTQPLRTEAAKRFRTLQLPETKEEWEKLRPELYRKTAEAMRLKIDRSSDLDYEETGSIRHDGITIKKISFRAAPNRYVTANLYIPDGEGPFPAILNVHGHRFQGKVAANVQSRGHVFAKCGYVCLSTDVFGAGERTTTHGVPEYHGRYRGASLMNVGETLMGIQVAESMRAIDLLQSFPFVDKDNIGVTGASGGGNQTMYVAAMDERVKAAVPVCSVGTYEVYVRSLNCFCELMPGGLNFTEEYGILALTAPRALKICNGVNDIEVFSVNEMLRSFNEAKKVFRFYNAEVNLTHEVLNRVHGYFPEALEAAVGFFDLHLKGVGHGMARQVPDYTSLPENDLMVWQPKTAPTKLKSMIAWTNEKAGELAKNRSLEKDTAKVKDRLKALLHGSKTLNFKNCIELSEKDGWRRFSIEADDVMIPVLFKKGTNDTCSILASDINKTEFANSRIYQEAEKAGNSLLIFDPYGTGELYAPEFSMHPMPPDYHNLTRHCAWLGFSMFGIWTQEFNILADWIKTIANVENIIFGGLRDAGAAAIYAAAVSNKASGIMTEKTVFSLNLAESAFTHDAATLALAVQDILCIADISTAAALSDASICFIQPIHGDGTVLSAEEQKVFASAMKKETELFMSKSLVTILD